MLMSHVSVNLQQLLLLLLLLQHPLMMSDRLVDVDVTIFHRFYVLNMYP